MSGRGKKKKLWRQQQEEKKRELINWYDTVIDTLNKMQEDYKGTLCNYGYM